MILLITLKDFLFVKKIFLKTKRTHYKCEILKSLAFPLIPGSHFFKFFYGGNMTVGIAYIFSRDIAVWKADKIAVYPDLYCSWTSAVFRGKRQMQRPHPLNIQRHISSRFLDSDLISEHMANTS